MQQTVDLGISVEQRLTAMNDHFAQTFPSAFDRRYLEIAEIGELRRRGVGRTGANVLRAFLHESIADAVARELLDDTTWRKRRHLYVERHGSRTVSDKEWHCAPLGTRFSSSDYLQCSAEVLASRPALTTLLSATVHGPWMERWLSLVLGKAVQLNTWELVRYGPGDFVAEHTDHRDGRLFAGNLYLDTDLASSGLDGGLLEFRSDGGPWMQAHPEHGALSLFPIAPSLFHRVTPWLGDRAGRITLSMSFRAVV
ncbi:2OG-Fe(II) oxygenase [Verminephrobacter aporrectodeae]|uniref:2OG-Fe(II) oxygenase n=1 Tax=Verminephrobacter aporrectodeae TaxID=1110389 RepID=UPI002236FEDB|nr:2OG-Fe(II) oxygenase [Verminephrobacter aporrectodeae]